MNLTPAYARLRGLTLFSIILLAASLARADDYAWKNAATANWSAANAWLVNGTTSSVQGGPGTADNIITPISFSILKVHGNQEINHFTFDSSSSWTIDAETNVQSGATPRSMIIHGNLAKNGAGTLLLRKKAADSFAVMVNNLTMGANGGVLTFDNDVTTLAIQGDIAIDAGSTLNFGTPVSLESGKTLSGSGVINANATLATSSGAIIAPGGSGVGILTFNGANNAGAVLNANGAVLKFDFSSGNASDRIVFNNYTPGDLVLNATLNGTGVVAGTFQIASFYSDGGSTPAATGNLNGGITLGAGFNGFTTSLNYTASGITLTVSGSGTPDDPDPTEPTDPDPEPEDPSNPGPTPPIDTTPPEQTWLPVAHRFKESYEAGVIGNRGLQYQMVVAWNQGTADPTKRGWIVTGQDENIVRISKDYGATWDVPRLAGLFCSTMGGLYLDTDDDIFVAVGNAFSNVSNNPGYAGLYYGNSDLLSVQRLNLARGSKNVFASVVNGLNADRNINCIGRRPQNAARTLTAAERPLIVIEQSFANGAIDAMYVWRGVIKPDHTWSWEQVAQLDPTQYSSGFDGVSQVAVAPNGDVLLTTQKGAFLCQNILASSPSFTKIYPASGDQPVSSGYFFGGNDSDPSGARIGVDQANANGGVYETSNVRASAFSKPNGNNGLPANYRVWHLGGSPVNPDRLAVCTTGGAPYYSIDGGKNFTEVVETKGSGDTQGRYNISVIQSHGHAGFYFCPTDELKCLTPTAQTMSRSIDGAVTTNGDLTAFFDGMHTKGVGFHPTDYLQIGRTAQDTGLNLAADGMHWLRDTGTANASPYNGVVNGITVTTFGAGIAAAGGGSEGYLSSAGMCFAPTKDRVVAFFHRNSGGVPAVPVVLENFDSAGKPGNILIKEIGKSLCTNSRVSPKDPTVAFVGRWAISNLDGPSAEEVVFTDHNLHEIVGCFLDMDGTTLVSYWSNVRPGSATNQSGTAIWRSTDDLGVTSQGDGEAWYTLPTGRYASPAICVDLHSPERILYVRSDNTHAIREVKRVGSALVDTELVNLRTMPGGLLDTVRAEVGDPALSLPPMPIAQLLSDPNKAGVFYAIIGRHGVPNWWRTVDDGVTWTNISDNIPRTLWTGAVSPFTGEVLGFSSLGEHIHKSPDIEGYPALLHRDAYSKQISDYFAAVNDHPMMTTSTSQPDVVVGESYNLALQATGSGGPFVWSLASGSLPPGLSLSSDGILSGTPTTAGSSTFTVTLADSDIFYGAGDEQTQTFTLTVVADSVPEVVTSTLPAGTYGVAYSQSIGAIGGNGTLVWSLVSGALPPGLSLSSTGLISGTPQISGTSSFTVRVADSDGIIGSNDEDTATVSLTVNPAPTSITIAKLVQRYDGQPKAVEVSSPSGDPITVTYDGSVMAPTVPGVYDVIASISSPTHSGSATEKLTITITAQVRRAPTVTAGLDGSAQIMTGETLSLGGGSWVTGDLLLPGTPTVTKSGGANYLGQIQGPGSAAPAGYAVKLSGGAALRNIVHHVDPLVLPVVLSPAQPTGTRNVTLSSPTQNAGDFATVHNLTLSGNVGSVVVPPGTYGSFTASGSSAFVLGVAGATEPAVYQLQNLTVSTQLQVVGPVVLLVEGNVTVNGSGVLGSPADPELLTILIAQGGLTASGATRVYGNVVAPNAGINLSGSATLRGTVISDALSITGGALLEEPEL